MITTSDIANILYRDCAAFGIERYQEGNIPIGEIDGERIVIHSKEQSSDSVWKKNFAEVNFYVANDKNGNARLIRLQEIQRAAEKMLNGAGRFDGTTYSYKVSSSAILSDEDLRAWYVNVKVLFRVINVME